MAQNLFDLTGKVVEMSPGADPASHTFTVKLEISGARVASGLTGRTYVDSGKRKAVLVPAGAILSQGGLQLAHQLVAQPFDNGIDIFALLFENALLTLQRIHLALLDTQ